MINVHTRGPDEKRKLVGTITPLDGTFYQRIQTGTPSATLWGLNVKLEWKFQKVIGILVEPDDLPKLEKIGFKWLSTP